MIPTRGKPMISDNPSPEEIRRRCAAIQLEWDEETERKRRWTRPEPYELYMTYTVRELPR